MLRELPLHDIYLYICVCFVPSNFAIVRSYLPSMLLQRDNSEFRGANKQKSVTPVRSYSLHFWDGNLH